MRKSGGCLFIPAVLLIFSVAANAGEIHEAAQTGDVEKAKGTSG
jgi:hypothetical protein